MNDRTHDQEQRIGLGNAARLLSPPGGPRLSATTVWRWTQEGYRGAILEASRDADGKLFTTAAAIRRFQAALRK